MSGFRKKVEDIFDVTAEGTASIVGNMVSELVVGQVLPGATTAYFSYKQKRAERNFEIFAREVKEREQEFNQRLSEVEDELFKLIKENYFGIITDYVIDEVQEEKIKYIVNGLVNLTSHEKIYEDFVLTYYDTLRGLRMIDIAILRYYYDSTYKYDNRSYHSILDEFGIEYEQYDSVREKGASSLNNIGL